MTDLDFHVTGTPVQQGSKVRYGRRLVETSAATLEPWRGAVATNALAAARRTGWQKYDGALSVEIVFNVIKPPTAPKRRKYPSVRPDLDKLIRAILDGITDSNAVWADDGRVVDLFATKRYAPAGQTAGAWVKVSTEVDE